MTKREYGAGLSQDEAYRLCERYLTERVSDSSRAHMSDRLKVLMVAYVDDMAGRAFGGTYHDRRGRGVDDAMLLAAASELMLLNRYWAIASLPATGERERALRGLATNSRLCYREFVTRELEAYRTIKESDKAGDVERLTQLMLSEHLLVTGATGSETSAGFVGGINRGYMLLCLSMLYGDPIHVGTLGAAAYECLRGAERQFTEVNTRLEARPESWEHFLFTDDELWYRLPFADYTGAMVMCKDVRAGLKASGLDEDLGYSFEERSAAVLRSALAGLPGDDDN